MSLSRGSRLGAHEIVGLLGAGGMGEVYLAQDTKLNRRVAIKVLPEAYANDPERVSRFHREAQAVAALNHTNIAAIHDLAEAEGMKFLVLELIEGDTLAERLAHGAIPIEEALTITRQILEALEVAHTRGICHRDLKPANIKLTPDGVVKVLDFGLAKFIEGPAVHSNRTNSPTLSLAGTVAGVILGTAGYMSPEQAKGYEADHRSDIFAVGCILYEMITGRRGFDGDTASEILASVLKSDVDWALLPTNLNPRLVDVLRRCLEKNPKKRWHAAADVRLELEALADKATVVDEPRVAAVAPVAPWWKRVLLPAAMTIIGAAVAGSAAWMLKPEAQREVTRFAYVLPDGQTFSNTGRMQLAVSPDGRTLAYVANRQVFLRPLAGLVTTPLAGSETPNGVSSPVFSPDGQWIAVRWNPDNSIRKLPITGGSPVTLVEGGSSAPVFAPNSILWTDRGLFITYQGKGIVRVAETGGVPEVVVGSAANEVFGAPQLLPDGKTLLFSIKAAGDSWDKGQVVVQPIGGGERRVVVTGGTDARYVPSGHLVFANGGVLYAQPFNLRTLLLEGSRVGAIDGVERSNLSGPVAAAQFSFAANGTMAYGPGPVTVTDADKNLLALFDRKSVPVVLKVAAGPHGLARVSRDGKWVVFESGELQEMNLFVHEISNASATRRLTFGGRNSDPVWSPDGDWIAYLSDREGDRAIFRQRADGSGTAERLTKPEKEVRHRPFTWSSDGKHLLFSIDTSQGATLWDLSIADRRQTSMQITSNGPIAADFSPDGRWFTYQVSSGGLSRSFVEPYPQTGAKYLIPTTSTSGHPFWSRDGSSITVNVGPTLSAVLPVSFTPRFSFGVPEDYDRSPRGETNPALTSRISDAMPDGRVLGTLRANAVATAAQADRIHIVVNWFDELRRIAPRR